MINHSEKCQSKILIIALFIKFILLAPLYQYSQNPTGCLTSSVSTYSVASWPYSLVTSDFNNDGILDIITGNWNNNSVISLLIGTGTGSFLPVSNFTATANASDIKSGDFNLDGNNDVVVTFQYANLVSIMFGDGAGGFTLTANYSTPWPTKIETGDINSDGITDLLIANSNNGSFTQLNGSSGGTFSINNTYSLGVNPIFIEKGYFNSDPYVDVCVLTINDQLKIYAGSSNGILTLINTYTLPTGAWEIAPNDYNSDSYCDLAINLGGSQSVLILNGNGNGMFSTGLSFSGIAVNTRGICSADFNLDGKFDLATGSSLSGISVLFGTGTSSFTSLTNLPAGSSPNQVITGDFNNDGMPDLAAANYHSASVTVFLSAIAPTISINTQGNNQCAGIVTTLTGNGANTYTWSTGFVSNSVSVSPSNTSVYSVTATSVNGCTTTAAITISVLPTPTISVASGTICEGTTFTANPTGAISYTFSNGGPVVSPSNTTTYSVIGTNSANCVSQIAETFTVTVNPLPLVTASGGSVCSGSNFTITPSGASTYSISGGSAVVSPTITTTYSVIGYTNGCYSSNTASITVSVFPVPVISVSDGTICSGESFTLTPTGLSNYTYSSGSSVITPTVSFTYSITGSDLNGCGPSSPAVANIVVNQLPNVSIYSVDSILCAGQTNTLIASGAITYLWNNAFAGDSLIINPLSTTVYSVIGTDSNSCSNFALHTQSVNICTSTAKNNLELSVTVYPNPSAGELTIDCAKSGKLQIISSLGRIILESNVIEGKNFFNLKGFSGIYVVTFECSEGQSISKIVLENN